MCEIGWWRGYVKSEFYAAKTVEGDDDVGEDVARSPAFRWRRNDDPPLTDDIVAAHDTLVAKLLAAGWMEFEIGDAWYRRRFRRRVES